MAVNYIGETGLTKLAGLIKQSLKGLVAKTDIVDNVTTDDATKVPSAAAVKRLADGMGDAGGGDMMKSVYDTDSDGVVDDAKKLDGHAASYFATSDAPETYVTGQKGKANGLAPLGADSKIDAQYLPDDIGGDWTEISDSEIQRIWSEAE